MVLNTLLHDVTRVQSQSPKPITGTNSDHLVPSGLRGAPEPSRDIFVYRIRQGNNQDTMTRHMHTNDVTVRSVEQVSNADSKCMNFKVEAKLSDLETVLSPDFWPEGVCVR